MNKNISIVLLIAIIAVLTAGHIGWHNLFLRRTDQMKDLKTENGTLSVSLEQCEETVYKLCQENDALKAKIDELHESKTEILEYEYVGEYTITAYCCEKYPHICGGGNTASGVAPTSNLTCAVGDLEKYPFGTILYIEGVGIRVVQDTGGFGESKIDVAVEKHEDAVKWDTGKRKVWIIKE